MSLQQVLRRTAICVSPLLLFGCSYTFPLDLVVRNGQLLFWTEREWRWLIFPVRPKADLCAIDVWTGRSWVWRIKADPCRPNGIPIAYASPPPPGVEVLVPPQPLRTGVRYSVRVTSWDSGAMSFELDRDRRLKKVGEWADDPEQQVFTERRDRRIDQLRQEGMTEEQGIERWNDEQARRVTDR
jgi:hypothetical protein